MKTLCFDLNMYFLICMRFKKIFIEIFHLFLSFWNFLHYNYFVVSKIIVREWFFFYYSIHPAIQDLLPSTKQKSKKSIRVNYKKYLRPMLHLRFIRLCLPPRTCPTQMPHVLNVKHKCMVFGVFYVFSTKMTFLVIGRST